VRPIPRGLAKNGDEVFMELRPRVRDAGEYAIIGNDLTRVATFRVIAAADVVLESRVYVASSKESLPIENSQSSLPMPKRRTRLDSGSHCDHFDRARANRLVCIAEWGFKGNSNGGRNRGEDCPKTAPAITQRAGAAGCALSAELRNAALKTLDGRSLKLSDFADKVVVLISGPPGAALSSGNA